MIPAPRLRGRTTLPSALALALTAVMLAAPAGTAAPPPSQQLVLLVGSHTAMSAPNTSSVVLQVVGARRPITEEQTVLPVLGHKTANGVRWLLVRLPGRPNSGTGWITKRGTIAAVTRWHLVVDTATRRVIVYQGGRPLRAFAAVVGKPSTPTPAGEFFVEEDVKLGASEVGAPYAIALSARSNVFQEFEGGPGQVALHGLANIGGVPGSAVSHGCVRLDAAAMRWLVTRVGPGVPVTITR